MSAKVLISKIYMYAMSALVIVPEFWKLLFDQLIGYNLAYSLNKTENVEVFIQPATGQPKPDPVLISAYVSYNQRYTDFLCSFHP